MFVINGFSLHGVRILITISISRKSRELVVSYPVSHTKDSSLSTIFRGRACSPQALLSARQKSTYPSKRSDPVVIVRHRIQTAVMVHMRLGLVKCPSFGYQMS